MSDAIYRHDFRLINIGAKTIKAITAPIMTIPSVEPISDLSCAGGVGVACRKKEAPEKLDCVDAGAE